MGVRYALLALLSDGPKHGPQLREDFEAWSAEVGPLNIGKVDTALRRLERDGLVESDGDTDDGPQTGFRLTADGQQELAGWLRTPPDLATPPRDELVMKVLVALRVPGIDVQQVVQANRRCLVERMQQWTRIKQDKADHELGLALAVQAELFRLDAVIRWLDATDDRLQPAAASPFRPAPQMLPRLRMGIAAPPGRTNHQRATTAIPDHIRVSDADRERATARLRDHFAEGRLTREELDERITAALKARTAGDLRRVMADLPHSLLGRPGPLDTTDAAVLAELLHFLTGWLARDPGRLGASLEDFAGNPTCNIGQLREDLDRFAFLLSGRDGEPPFGPPQP